MLYHGTNSYEIYEKIKKDGFKPGTYFTPFLDTAICYGGQYVFAVDLESDYNIWEVIINDQVSPDKILYIQKYDVKLLHHNRELSEKRHKERIEEVDGKIFCTNCDGHGEHITYSRSIEYLNKPAGGSFKTRTNIDACDKCRGYGYINGKHQLKKAYGLEHLVFNASGKVIECEYTDTVCAFPEEEDNIKMAELDWILKSLSMQQGNVYFKDAAKLCTGMDELKRHYLLLKLAGI